MIKAIRDIEDLDVSSVALRGSDDEVVVQIHVRGRNVEVRLAELAERDDVVDVILAS